MIERVKSWASDLAQKGKEGADDLVRKIVDGIAVLPQKMFDAGKNLVEGLWDGITGMGSWLRDKIGGFAGGIIDGFKETFGIASPSKVMRDEVGRYLAEGIGTGLERGLPDIADKARGMLTGIRVDAGAVDLMRHPQTIVPQIAPSATGTVVNNSYITNNTTNNAVPDARPLFNIHATFEVDGERFAEYTAERVDLMQGEAITFDERGTAH